VDVGKDGGKADGKITEKDLKAFANSMENRLCQAEKTLHKYEKEHPDADPSSKQLVRSAALLLANEPLTQEADKRRKVNGCASAAGLAALQGNDGLADVLQNVASTWSKPGMFDLLIGASPMTSNWRRKDRTDNRTAKTSSSGSRTRHRPPGRTSPDAGRCR
jgi:hypothetical protein